MTVDKICFEQLFPTGEYANQRLRVEGTLSEGESITEAFNHAKAMVDDAFKAMNPGITLTVNPEYAHLLNPSQLPETQVTKVPEDLRIANMIADIKACTSIPKPDGLESFWLGVQQSGNQQIMDAYVNKLQSLQNK